MDSKSKLGGAMKVLTADSGWISRVALSDMLKRCHQSLEVLDADDLDQTLEHARAQPELDLVLIDPFMRGSDGLSALREMREMLADAPIIVINGVEDREEILCCVELGAMGYILKTAESDEILKAIDLVLSGYAALPAEILIRTASRSHTKNSRSVRRSSSIINEVRLTQRQTQIVELLAEGLNNSDIANRLGISANTVSAHGHEISNRQRFRK